jgi:iron(III) transport system substrate-binding protein
LRRRVVRRSSRFGIIGALALMLAACAAPAAPAPTAAPAKPAEKSQPPAKPAAPAEKAAPAAKPADKAAAPAATGASDADWQKVVEAARNEKITIYGRLLSGPEGTQIAEAVKKDTGITVEFVAAAGSPSFSRIKEESKAGRPTADIYEGSQPWPSNIEREGYFVKMKDMGLPVFKEPASVWNVDPWFMSPDGYYLGTRFSDFESHIAINTRVIPLSDAPKNWAEYSADPRYVGKISWVDPKTTQDIGTIWARHGYVGKGLTLDDLWNIYNKQEPQLFPNPVDASGAVGRGEAGMSTSATGLLPALSAGAPVKLILFPEVPSVSLISGMGIIKDTPNMNAAKVFVNWVMSKQGMEVIARVNQNKTIRTDVPSGVNPGLNSEVLNNGKRGPSYALSAAQAELAGEVENAGVMRMLTEGASLADFKAAYDKFIKEWEAKKGGVQDKPTVLTE